MQFRSDINGLRAYAVIAVVIFHFNKDWLPGGFIGVDVFFVISGYLMTGIIFSGIEHARFSLSDFYLARANRIIPALGATCLATLITGIALLAPEDLRVLGKHMAYSAGFISNVAYQGEAGYFDVASHDKWLLHTWSLSVEWQFYIIYPLIILAFKRLFGVQVAKSGVVIAALSSFLLCIWASQNTPSESFYSLSSRAWEMMLGGVAFLYPLRLQRTISKALELFGFGLIVLSIILLDGNDVWPGILTMVPVVGTWLIISANQQTSLLTNNLIMQKIGSWSYSIYLWHWPAFVLLNHFSKNSTGWILAGIILSILLGYLSYRLIEQKVRFNRASKGIKLTLHPAVAITILSVTIGLVIEKSDGFPDRFPPAVADTFRAVESSPFRENCHSRKQAPVLPENACTYFSENITWAVLGDSHTIELSYALAEMLESSNEGVRHYSFSGCIPSYMQPDDFSKCAKWTNSAVKDLLSRGNINSVLINYRYARALYGENVDTPSGISDEKSADKRAAMFWSLNKMVEDIAAAKKSVYIMLPIPELTERMPNILAQNYEYGQQGFTDIPGKSLSYFLSRSKEALEFFSDNNFPENVILINPMKHFCDERICYAVRNGKPLYFDDDHPSLEGARKMLLPIKHKVTSMSSAY